MQSSRKKLELYFEERFDVNPEFWSEFQVREKSGSLWIVSEDVEIDEKAEAAGIRALRDTNLGLKPTTYILQFLDSEISRRVVELDRDDLERLVFDREVLERDIEHGYVALKYRGRIIGCGLQTRNGLRTQVPKGRSHDLEAMLGD